MINSQLIKDRMKEKSVSQKQIALAMRIAAPTVSQKINNVRPLTLDEAEVLTKMLDIEGERFGEFFFANSIA